MDASWWSTYRHYAAVRGNGKFRIYVDGVMRVEAADTGYNINRNAPVIGKLNNFNGYELRGQLRNIRVVKGTALYSSNFTPPTTPLANVSGTLLLLLAQDLGNPTYDSSDNHFTPSNSSNRPTWLAP
jgi:predicted RNA-binding protein with PUA-like domain